MKLPKGIQIRCDSYVAYVTSPTGKPIRKVIAVVGCVGVKELVRLRADLEKQVRDGLYPPKSVEAPAPEVPPINCSDLWGAYRKDCQNRDVRRMDRLELAWSHLRESFGSKAAAEIKPTDIANYVTSRREAGMSNGTCNRELAILKAALRHGARLEMIERVPMFPRKLKEGKPRQGFVEETQYKNLMSKAQDPWLRCFVGLGFNFGMRKGELLALRVRDADLLEGWLTITDSKNGESRRVALTHETTALLTECIRGKQPDAFILTRPDGSRVAQPRKDWYSLCCRCSLGKMIVETDADGKTHTHYEGLQMHDLRRSAARRLVRRGCSEKVTMTICGWKTRWVFDRYNIVNERDVEQAKNLLEPTGQAPVSDAENRHKTDTSGFAHS